MNSILERKQKMKRKKLVRKLVVFSLWCLFFITPTFMFISGCETQKSSETGKTEFRIDPNKAQAVEDITGAGITLGTVLSLLYPALLPFVSFAGGLLTLWIKIRTKYNTFREENLLYFAIAESSVEAIDELKKLSPETAKVMLETLEEIKDKIISPADRLKVENVIRGLRGLPPVTTPTI